MALQIGLILEGKKMIVTFAFMLASFMNDDYVVAS